MKVGSVFFSTLALCACSWWASDWQLPLHAYRVSFLGRIMKSRPRISRGKLCLQQVFGGSGSHSSSFTWRLGFRRFLGSRFFSSVFTTRKGLHCLAASPTTSPTSRDTAPLIATSKLRYDFVRTENHSFTRTVTSTEYQPVLFNWSEWKSSLERTSFPGAVKALYRFNTCGSSPAFTADSGSSEMWSHKLADLMSRLRYRGFVLKA